MRRHWPLVVGLCLILAALISGCGNATAGEKLEGRHVDVHRQYPLLSLRYQEAYKQEGSFSGAFLFFVGAASGSSKTELRGYIGFVVDTSNTGGPVMMLRYPAEKIDYTLVKQKGPPRVLFHVSKESWDWYDWHSTTQNIQDTTDRVMLYLTAEQFGTDIRVLRYAGMSGASK